MHHNQLNPNTLHSTQPFSIPFTKHQLSNGLTVILHADATNPLVHVDVTYHVGSAREEIGKSGFAHFFEHMMFEGSKHIASNEHFKYISEAGGHLNGTTNRDRTNYFETLPKNQLELALWLEADRMGFLLEAVTLEKFENQRNVIKNEKSQRYENQPYGMSNQASIEALYPKGHPYSWTTIGYTEDLDRVTLDDLKAFFKRWYGPNNAVLTIGGDIDVDKTLSLVEKYFGSIPRGPEVLPLEKHSISLEKDLYLSKMDKVRFPMLQILYPTVPFFHPDEVALDILADLVGNGKNGLFYSKLVKNHQAVQASGSHYCFELAGEFRFGLFAYPGISLRHIEDETYQLLDDIHKNGVSKADVERVSMKYYSDMLYSLESVKNRVSKLASYETFLQNPDYLHADIERYKNVKQDDVMMVFDKYIYQKPAVHLSFYDKGMEDYLPREDNFHFHRELPAVIEHAPPFALSEIVIKDSFDRSVAPISNSIQANVLPEFYTHHFGNGLTLVGTVNHSSPTVSVYISIDAGSMYDGLGKSGLSTIFTKMMRESTQNSSAEEMNSKLEHLGSAISCFSTKEKLNISLNSLTENLHESLMLLKEIMLSPALEADELQRVVKEHNEILAFQALQTEIIANRIFNAKLYGEKHPLGQPTSGIIADCDTITTDDLRQFHATYFQPQLMKIIVSGDVVESELLPHIDFLTSLSQGESKLGNVESLPFNEGNKLYISHKDGAPQSDIRIGFPALKYDPTGEFFRCTIMNYVLGDSFNSRINLNLREDKGFTYGAHSYFNGAKYSGSFVATAAVKASDTVAAIHELVKEIKNYHDNGMTQKELDYTKRSLLYRDALKYETNAQKTNFLYRMAEYDLTPSFADKQKKILQEITVEELNALATKYLNIENMVFVVSGDKNAISATMDTLGMKDIIIIEQETLTQ